MPRGAFKSPREIERLQTIVEHLSDNASRPHIHDPLVIAAVLRWVTGADDEGIEGYLGSLESIYEDDEPPVLAEAS